MIEFKGFSRDDFELDLKNEIARNGAVPNLLITDVRDFTKVNATVGVKNCDAFLRRFFNILKDTLPSTVNLYSFGGDQFVVKFQSETSELEVLSVSDQIKKLCENPVMLSGVTFRIDVWVGIRPSTKESIHVTQVISELLLNLSKVKNSIYDIVDVSDCLDDHDFSNVTLLNSQANEKYNLARINQVTSGIRSGGLVPFGQAIVDGAGKLLGYEILARMSHRNELDFPDRFMPIIRTRCLMSMFTKEIFTKVLEVLTKYSVPDNPSNYGLFLSFNIDFETMADLSCCDHIKNTAIQLRKYGFNTKLEISEESIAEDHSVVDKVFENYTSAGIELSIDDFGTINSNFHRVRSLSFSEIKVDKSYGLTCLIDKSSALFVSFTMELALIKDAVCVVEGVETKEQFEFLKKLGINRFQGYYFSRPLPLHSILQKNDEASTKIRKF